MEGREAKHIAIATYARNTTYQQRWEQIFLHEYISLIWLREKGYHANSIFHSKLSYVPKCVKKDEYCNCGLNKLETDAECRFCSYTLRDKIKFSIDNGKVVF